MFAFCKYINHFFTKCLLSLILILTFSCSSLERENSLDPKAINYNAQLSSSIGQSNSSSSSSREGTLSSSSAEATSSSSKDTMSSNSGCDGFKGGLHESHYGMPKEQFCDERDGNIYVYVGIGDQTWMAENLNHAYGGECYNKTQDNCDKYGRLYSQETAKKACPNGWHLPKKSEWEALDADDSLKVQKAYWPVVGSNWQGSDTHGFAALPGGAYINSDYEGAGNMGYWWIDSQSDNDCFSSIPGISSNYGLCIDSNVRFSVRCVKD